MSWALLVHDVAADAPREERAMAAGVRGRLGAMSQGKPALIEDPKFYEHWATLGAAARKDSVA